MIHYLKIKNFGPIKDEVEINFEVVEGGEADAYEAVMPDGRKLLKLAYIYGANASGKTTVLDGFKFLKEILINPLAHKGMSLPYYPFEFSDKTQALISSFELSFYANEKRYIYFVEFTPEDILSERAIVYQSPRPTELFLRKTDTEKRLSKVHFGSKVKVPLKERDLLEALLLHNNTVFGAFAKTNFDIPDLQKLNDWFTGFLMDGINSSTDLSASTAMLLHKNPKIKQWINSYLNKADNQIVEVTLPDDMNKPASEVVEFFQTEAQTKIGFVHTVADKTSYTLPLIRESSGTKRYFGLGAPLYQLIHENHFLSIDELETSLHPDLMKHFLQIFLMNAENSQLLITTHNLSLMADTDFIRRDALWLSEKASDGSVCLYSVSEFDTATLRKDASLINAYKAGKLGAKPNLGSPYIPQ